VADGAIDANTDVFFGPALTPGLNFTTDPRIRYDRLSDRWFIIMIDVPGQQGKLPNRVMLAMSDSGTVTANTVWTFFHFAGNASNFADYPTLGIDANALYIGANIFSTSSGSLVTTSGFVVRKSSLLSGGPIVVTAFTGLVTGHAFLTGPFTPQGVDNYDPAATEGYFIGADAGTLNSLDLRRISNPGGTPSISGNVSISVGSFASPITVSVQGTVGTNVDGLDRRLMAAHFRNGSLWTSHNVGVNSSGGTSSPDRNGVQWFQITGIPTGQTPSVAQSGTVYNSGSPSVSYWMGTIMVSGQGHAAMGFTTAGPNNFLDAATTGRLAGDSTGTMGIPVVYTSSSSAYNPSDHSNPHRWGDYSYTSLDPSDDMTMWTVQEWCQFDGNGFAVQVAQLLAPPPALPTNCTPSVLTQSVVNVNIAIKGSRANGAGFFEPGTNFPKHISATVNGGGVTVNSLTYNNPTNLTANVTVAPGAATGARALTITNPDGQSVTSASILTIVSSGPAVNHSPVLAAIANRTNIVGTTLTFTNTATDTDSPPQTLIFSLAAGAATNANIGSNGLFSWTSTQAQIGSNAFSVFVTDNGSPPLSSTQSFFVRVVQTNGPPSLAGISNRTIAVGMTLAITNAGNDVDGDQLTFTLGAGAAANASINATSGVFTWAPTQAQIGTNAFSVLVTDNGSPPLSATQSFVVVVVHSNSPPVLAGISNRTMAVGMTLTVTNAASDTDGDQLSFSLSPTDPTNASINGASGVLTWAPTQDQVGTNQFGVVVTDDGLPPLSATQNFTVIVVPSNTPPVLAAISNQTIYAKTTLVLTNSASDLDVGQTLAFSLDAGAPAGAQIGAADGIFLWTPDATQTGAQNVTVRVTDDGFPNLSEAKSFTVNVLSGPALSSITYSNTAVTLSWSAIAGMKYRVQFASDITESTWTDIVPDIVANSATASLITSNTNLASFYRVIAIQ
jgi:hypothetical protein